MFGGGSGDGGNVGIFRGNYLGSGAFGGQANPDGTGAFGGPQWNVNTGSPEAIQGHAVPQDTGHVAARQAAAAQSQAAPAAPQQQQMPKRWQAFDDFYSNPGAFGAMGMHAPNQSNAQFRAYSLHRNESDPKAWAKDQRRAAPFMQRNPMGGFL